MSKTLKCIIPLVIGVLVFLLKFAVNLPVTINQWLYFCIFLTTIITLILEPIPAALIGFIGMATAVLFKVGPKGSGIAANHISSKAAMVWGLSGFSNAVIWLIFAAFMIGIGYTKSGLGKRIALVLVHKLGKTTLGLGYAIAIIEGILAPFIPSNSARSGGIIYPIVSNIVSIFDSHPNDESSRKLGSYLCYSTLAVTCVTSSMFLTGQAPNALAVEITQRAGLQGVTWIGWFISFLPVGIIGFLLTPWLVYKIYPPQIKKVDNASTWAKSELDKIGKITGKEISMAIISICALVLWVGSEAFGIYTTLTAILVIIFMVFTKILTWDDILANKPAWNVLIWFGTLVTLAGGLGNTGLLEIFGKSFSHAISGISPLYAVLGLILVFYFIHYFFASVTAHVTALLGMFLAIAIGIHGFNHSIIGLLLILPIALMMILTPYAGGPTSIWFASGYIPSKDFWRLGAIFGILFIALYLIVGFPWIVHFAYKYAF